MQQAAATQLFMAQGPVPVEMLLKEGVMKHLLQLTTQLATCCMSDGQTACLQVPASCMDPATGRVSMSACSFKNGSPMVSGVEKVAVIAVVIDCELCWEHPALCTCRVHVTLPEVDMASLCDPISV